MSTVQSDDEQQSTLSFQTSFERWRLTMSNLFIPSSTTSNALRCDTTSTTSTSTTSTLSSSSWSDGKIMQTEPMVDSQEGTAAGSALDSDSNPDKDRKRERNECKRCETWRDELTRESEF